MVAGDALRRLADVLARTPSSSPDHFQVMLDHRTNRPHFPLGVLAMARFLAHCTQRHLHEDLLNQVLTSVIEIPSTAGLDVPFFAELCGYLAAMASNWDAASLGLSRSVLGMLDSPGATVATKAFLQALYTNCFSLDESMTERICQVLLDRWLPSPPEGVTTSTESPGTFTIGTEVTATVLDALERQKVGFRIFVYAIEGASEVQVQQLCAASTRQLRTLTPLLKIRKRGDTQRISLTFEVSQAAATAQAKALLKLQRISRCPEGVLWDSLTLLMDAADSCITSPCRGLRACEVLFDSLLSAVADLVAARGNQTVLHRLRLLVLRTCACADTWGTNQGPFFKSVVKSGCSIIQAGWDVDRSAVESFLLSLAAQIRQCEQDEKEKNAAVMKLNVIPLLTDMAMLLNKCEIVNTLMPMFIESLEEGDAATPSLMRLRLLDAVARMASLGFEDPYKEAVALLMKSYKDKLSTVGSTHSRTLAPEATTERVETLPAAFQAIAVGLTVPKLRADYRLRLLTLCSEVGLVAEAKSSRSGGDLLGPLLPAVAEICSDFRPSKDVDPILFKQFRNLWFYIVLFGLAPPLQKTAPPSTSRTSGMSRTSGISVSSLGSINAMQLQAVAGPYPWNVQWSAAVERIAQGTPPLIVGSTKWLEDELELNALHNPGSRRAGTNEKAAFAQRTALAKALGGRVEVASMSSISGVKATYLLAVAFLELLRFSGNGGIFKDLKGDVVSSLSCSFAYLETANLTADVSLCLSAIIHRAFDAAMSWLAGSPKNEDRETVLVTHATFLIHNLVHQKEHVREIADALLSQLRNRFPQVLWSARCLDSLLQLLSTPDQGTAAVPRSFLPQRVEEWIAFSLLIAPATTQGILQENVLSNGGKHLPLLTKIHVPNGHTPASNIVIFSGLYEKSGLIGKIDGLLEGKPQHRLDDGIQNGTLDRDNWSRGETLLAQFLQSLQQFVTWAENGDAIDGADYRKACLESTALLLSRVGLSRMGASESYVQLLRLLCWCPAYIFTPAAMGTGISVWTWLLSAAPQLGCSLLSELVDAWLWTIDTGRGIFASGVENSGPAAKLRPQLTPGEPGPVNDSVAGILAHRLWLEFLLERFEVIKHSSNEELLLIGRLLQGSVKSASHFTCHPAATGTFFTLMLLGFKYCSWQLQNGHCLGADGALWLEDRFYRASLGWFSVQPGWYDPKDPTFSNSEALAMAAFVQHLSSNQNQAEHHESAKTSSQDSSTSFKFSSIDNKDVNEKRKQLLLMLSQHEADRLQTWANPLKDFNPRFRAHADKWPEYVRTAWSVDPRLALALVSRFPYSSTLTSEVTVMVQNHLTQLRRIPEALPYFVTPKAVDEDSPVLYQLPHWAPCSITRALEFLTPPFKGHCRVMAYVLRVLESYPPERVTFFMPQLVQALRYDQGGLVEGYLMVAAKRSDLFAHILIWQLQGGEPPDDAAKESPVSKGNSLHEIVPRVKKRIIDSFTAESYAHYDREFKLFDQVTSISGVLYPLPKEERRAAIQKELEKIQVVGYDSYLPTDPSKLVRGIKVDSGIPLQSAAKVPIMITFEVVDKDGDHTVLKHQACIFKVGDDCRQDVLALQVIALLRDIFVAVGLDLYLFPYGVLPTGYGRGIVEVVPNTRSRNQMGEMTDGGLYELFQQDYGPVGSPSFEAARDNFIISSAGYAVASLILQPKDRHNGNLLFDSDGRLVHIDFGFILETSPGGNLRFESAQFKLSHEMTQLIDPSGSMKSETWDRFVSLCVKGYLAARQHMDGIVNTVLLMVDSGLPCFSRGDPIGNLRRRFHPEMSEHEAANFMIKTCMDAYNKWSTAGYDLIQYLQQGIEK